MQITFLKVMPWNYHVPLFLSFFQIATNQRHQAIAEELKTAFQDTKEEIRNKVAKDLKG